MKNKISFLIAIFVIIVLKNYSAYACPETHYESPPCIFGKCICLPKCGGAICDGVQHVINEAKGQLVGIPLEQYIIESRDTSIKGSLPIPPHIREALRGYIDEDAMNRARYRIQDHGAVNLAHLILQIGSVDGSSIGAVTLIDVIVFRGSSETDDPTLWAHELTHVAQYRDWGVHNFVVSYARDWHSVEDAAYAKGNGFLAWFSTNRAGGPLFCMTPAGRFGPMADLTSPGEECHVNMDDGTRVFGRVAR